MPKQKKKFFTRNLLKGLLLSIFIHPSLSAQESFSNKSPQYWLKLATEQYSEGHYKLAAQSAEAFMKQSSGIPEEQTEAEYVWLQAELKLQNESAASVAKSFVETVNDPAYKQRTSLALAQYFFRKEQLSEAIDYYEAAKIDNLRNSEIADLKFELAYCYFNHKEFEKAIPLFASIKEVPGKYFLAGNYYYGLLAYDQGNYDEALISFQRIEKELRYRNIVPYYIAEIYYFKGDRTKALNLAKELIQRQEKLFYDNELHLLAAQILFEEQQYAEAIPFFETYYERSEKIRKQELYEMAYSYYRVSNYKNAIEKFKPLSLANDSLGQTAMYLLGDCYLKEGNKKNARNAFSISAGMNYNKGQQEASLLLFGKLSYEAGFNTEALGSFKELISQFPHSDQVSEAKTWLSDLLIRTNNYEEAYSALQDVSVKNNNYWKVQQKVAYGLAIQQTENGNLGYADELFGQSLQNPLDPQYEAAAWFWRGDVAYRSGHYTEAITYLQKFIATNSNRHRAQDISEEATIPNAYLVLGYAAMAIKDFGNAQLYFNLAKQNNTNNPGLAANAMLREADAAFMQKNFQVAQNLYQKVVALHGVDADYAQLQNAIIAGILGRTAEKINLLEPLLRNPSSSIAQDARYELAITYIEDEKFAEAISTLAPLTKDLEGRNLASKAWMKIGFSYQQLDDNDFAIAAYRHVITDFPASEDRASALEALKSLYIENNEPGKYADMLKDLNLPASGMESLDSTYYAAAEAQISAGKWANAKTALLQYLEKFPNGAFVMKAQYYAAESNYQLKDYVAALYGYDLILNLPWNDFTEISALRASEISYKKEDFAGAKRYYRALRNNAMSKDNLQTAITGLMKTSFSLKEFEDSYHYADTLSGLPEVNENLVDEAKYFKAKSLQEQNQNEEAIEIYRPLRSSKVSYVAAEAGYRVAEIYFRKNNLKDAEATADEVRKMTGNDYWVVKSYLLIADILVLQKDYYNAIATLKSVIKVTKITELKKEASEKLEQVKKLEKQQSKLKED